MLFDTFAFEYDSFEWETTCLFLHDPNSVMHRNPILPVRNMHLISYPMHFGKLSPSPT